jgi:hypothetical protein
MTSSSQNYFADFYWILWYYPGLITVVGACVRVQAEAIEKELSSLNGSDECIGAIDQPWGRGKGLGEAIEEAERGHRHNPIGDAQQSEQVSPGDVSRAGKIVVSDKLEQPVPPMSHVGSRDVAESGEQSMSIRERLTLAICWQLLQLYLLHRMGRTAALDRRRTQENTLASVFMLVVCTCVVNVTVNSLRRSWNMMKFVSAEVGWMEKKWTPPDVFASLATVFIPVPWYELATAVL